MLLSLRFMRRWIDRGRGRCEVPLEVLSRISTGPKQGVALLRVGSRVLVVSIGESGSNTLLELTGEDRERLLDGVTKDTGEEAQGRSHAERRRWLPALTRAVFLASALLVPVNPARLQAVEQAPAAPAAAEQGGSRASQFSLEVGQGDDGMKISGAVGIVVLMSVLTVLPALILMMTSFTRIIVVLHFLRAAMGTQTTPPGQLLVGIALMLTSVIMGPVLKEANDVALQPYLAGRIEQKEAYTRALGPFRQFMLANIKEEDLSAFTEISGEQDAESIEEISTMTIMSSFVTSELKTAFQMGFVIFLPFVVIDLIVASVLMSMGMFMLPPVMVSLPFKVLLFVLADGWTLTIQNLLASFRV